MKIFILLILFSKSLWALTCIDHSAGLVARVTRDKNELKFDFRSYAGYKAIPQVEGPIGPQQMPLVNYQLESLKEVNDGFEIVLPVAGCDLKRFSEGIFSCNHVGKIPGTQLSFSLLKAYRVKQMHDFGDYETQHFKLMINKEDTFFFLIPFPKLSCSY